MILTVMCGSLTCIAATGKARKNGMDRYATRGSTERSLEDITPTIDGDATVQEGSQPNLKTYARTMRFSKAGGSSKAILEVIRR